MRLARRTLPGALHHVICRFVDGRWYLRDDEERATYLRMLGAALSRTDWRCVAYCLMSSHIHLAMVAGRKPLSSWARRANSPFARFLNARHERFGSVFADRPDTWVIRPELEPRLLAYIHNNPVRAGVVPDAKASSWSSHRAYLGLVVGPDWLDIEDGLRRARVRDPASFAQLVRSEVDARFEYPDLEPVQREVRTRGALELGTPTIGDSSEVPVVARTYTHVRAHPLVLVVELAAALHVDVGQLRQRWSRGASVRGKVLAVHVARTAGVSLTDVGRVLGISRQYCSRLANEELDAGERRVHDEVCERLARRWASGSSEKETKATPSPVLPLRRAG